MTWPTKPSDSERNSGQRAPAVLFRCDGSSRLGLGHVIRCCALADELAQRNVEPWFAIRSLDGSGLREIHRRGYKALQLDGRMDALDEIAAIEAAAKQSGIEASQLRSVVMDHYDLGSDWLVAAGGITGQRVVIDDLADRALPCDVLVNGNLWSKPSDYADFVEPRTRLLLGPRYALIRASIAQAHLPAGNRTFDSVRSVLVAFGGTDQAALIKVAIEAVQTALPDIAIDLVVGSSSSLDGIDQTVVRIHTAVGDEVMTRLMMDADVAIGAGGISALERCALALPSILVRLAGNQDAVVDALAAAGAAVDAGLRDAVSAQGLAGQIRALARDRAARVAISRRGWELIDGRGAVRVAHCMEGVQMRPATIGDADLLWEWRNDPDVRAASTHSEAIPRDDHVRWLDRTLQDPSRLLLIGSNGAGDLGQVRFDRRDGEAELSISVAREHRGTVGGLLLEAGVHRFQAKWPGLAIRARVKVENATSRRLFEQAGFLLDGETDGLLDYRLVPFANPLPEGR